MEPDCAKKRAANAQILGAREFKKFQEQIAQSALGHPKEFNPAADENIVTG